MRVGHKTEYVLINAALDFDPRRRRWKYPWRLSVRNPADRASCVQRCCRLDAVGRKRSQQTASEHPACDRHTAFIQRALRCSFSAHVRGVGCPFVAAIHPGASIHASFSRASAGVRCVGVRDLWAPTIVLIALVGHEGHGFAGPQQVRRTIRS